MRNKHDTLSNCHPERIRSDPAKREATKESKDPEDARNLMTAVVLFHDGVEVLSLGFRSNDL
jgi:hypothetical protein